MSTITEQLQALLSPPLASTSQERALGFLDTTYPSFDALNDGDALDKAVEAAESRSQELNQKVSSTRFRRSIWYSSHSRLPAGGIIHCNRQENIVYVGVCFDISSIGQRALSYQTLPRGPALDAQ